MLNIQKQIFNIQCPIFNIQYQMFNIQYSISYIDYSISNIQYPLFNIIHKIFNIIYQISNIITCHITTVNYRSYRDETNLTLMMLMVMTMSEIMRRRKPQTKHPGHLLKVAMTLMRMTAKELMIMSMVNCVNTPLSARPSTR